MALKDRIIEIAYQLKDQFSQKVGKVTSSIRSVEAASDKSSLKVEANNNRLVSSFKRVGLAARGAVGRIAQIAIVVGIGVASIGRFIAASSAQERAETKLATTLINLTGAREDEIQALKDQAAALQQLTGFGDEETLSAQAQLATFKLNAAQIQQLTPLILDMAESQRKLGKDSIDLESISLAVGKAFTSGIGSLSRYGVALTDAQKEAFKLADQQGKVNIVTDALRDNFGGLAEAIGKEYDGISRKADAARGDAEEVAGSLFTGNQAFLNFQNAIARGWEALGVGLRGSATEIGQVITGVVGTINVAMQSIRVAFNLTQIAIKSSAFFINKSIALILQGLSKITFGGVSEKFRKSAEEINSYAEDLRDSIGEDVADIVDSVETMGTAFDTELEKAAKATDRAQQKIESASEKVVEALDTQIEAATKGKEAHEANAAALEKSLADSQNALKKSVSDARSIKAEFQQLVDEIRSGGGKADEDLTIVDFDKDLRSAQKALREGDFDAAIDGARQAADTLRAMQESGAESALVIGGPGGLADQLAKLANAAADGKVSAGEESVKSVEEQLKAMEAAALAAELAIKDLENRKVEINTDTEKSVQNLKDTQAAMQAQADGQPIVQPLVLGDSVAANESVAPEQNEAIDPTPRERIVQEFYLDTEAAEAKLVQFEAKAKQVAQTPIEKKIYVNEVGNSFTDRPSSGFSELNIEALRRGKRR